MECWKSIKINYQCYLFPTAILFALLDFIFCQINLVWLVCGLPVCYHYVACEGVRVLSLHAWIYPNVPMKSIFSSSYHHHHPPLLMFITCIHNSQKFPQFEYWPLHWYENKALWQHQKRIHMKKGEHRWCMNIDHGGGELLCMFQWDSCK